jgi:hypothetical protein
MANPNPERGTEFQENEGLDLHREEVRGLFVLGIIGVLLAIRNVVPWNIPIYYLLLYWGMYAFLMALGVSADIIEQPYSYAGMFLAKKMFGFGIAMFGALAAYAFINLVLGHFLSASLSSDLASVPTVILCGYLAWKIPKRLSKGTAPTLSDLKRVLKRRQ